MPHQSEIIPSLVVSSHGSWDDAARWYASLMRGRVTMSAEMQKDLARIVGTEDNDLDKMRKIFNHVNSSIRYVGFELGLGGLQPRNADLTYATRMGDCKDLTLVLVSMLRQSGIDARMALVRTRERGELDRSIPFIGQFNQAIVQVEPWSLAQDPARRADGPRLTRAPGRTAASIDMTHSNDRPTAARVKLSPDPREARVALGRTCCVEPSGRPRRRPGSVPP